MVHGGTMSGVNIPARRTAARAGRNISCGRLCGLCGGPARAGTFGLSCRNLRPRAQCRRAQFASPRFVAQEKFKLWPQADLHTQWPGNGEPKTMPRAAIDGEPLPAIADFTKQQFLNRDALITLFDRSARRILLVHSQAGAFGWPVADARPDLVKAILAIEPNGPPAYRRPVCRRAGLFQAGPPWRSLWDHRGAADLCAGYQQSL